MRSPRIIGATLVALLLSSCGGSAAAPTPTTTASSPAAPDGWRWESFRDIEVAVPANWTIEASSNDLLYSWCSTRAHGPGWVARPGTSRGVGCPQRDPALVAKTGRFVAFTGADDAVARLDHGERVHRTLGSVTVVVQAPEALRVQIAATARVITSLDAHGCPADHPVHTDAAWRPTGAPPIARLTDVTGISACRYALPPWFDRTPPGPGLYSSTNLNADQARQTLAAISVAPIGGGPDQPHSCIGGAVRGDEAIVALVHRAGAPDATLVMRYSGCDHNGIDDGTAVRRLTAGDAPLTAGANRPDHWDGAGKGAALSRPDADRAAARKARSEG